MLIRIIFRFDNAFLFVYIDWHSGEKFRLNPIGGDGQGENG
ncbi:hypothetical protein MICAG_2210042 [Microcystis aeruginosa PCC 9808]|uniref:Uncharacterized protein n=1 Tax=Microcystis aeruginosa PCC 9808 TaxID=1160284 RepID=I4HP89_MICAE|nr:hypothetical protein MICAG_2210042 [Microcystis aeruginosa PCC 9808]